MRLAAWAILIGVWAAPLAWGQGGRLVDQTVEDMDPRAASLRVIDPGNAQFPSRSMIVERAHAASWSSLGVPTLDRTAGMMDNRAYEYRAPGVRAMMSRPDYMVIDSQGSAALNRAPGVDGAFLELAPANTVFNLTPDDPAPIDPAAYDPYWHDTRVDGRIDYSRPSVRQTTHHAYAPLPTTDSPNTPGQRYQIRRLNAKNYDTDSPTDAAADSASDSTTDAADKPSASDKAKAPAAQKKQPKPTREDKAKAKDETKDDAASD